MSESEKPQLNEGHLIVIKAASEEFGVTAKIFNGGTPDELFLFNETAAILFQFILNEIATIEGVPNSTQLDPNLCLQALRLTVNQFNTTLPLTYPFIVVILINGRPDNLNLASMYRGSIPGMHDNLERGLIPIVNLRKGGAQPGKAYKFDNIKIDFIGKLEDIPRDLLDESK